MPTSTVSELSSFPPGGAAVVFGASGGIGRALVDELRRSDAFVQVVPFSRNSDPAIDLEDEASLTRAAKHASDVGDIRLAIDATGFLHDALQQPEKTWRDIEPTKLARSFALNSIGPALIMKHVLPHFPRLGKAVFATLSARVGSIGDNRLGGWYSYRASKAALNQLVRTAAIELRRRSPDSICVALHPGTVDTPLSVPFRKDGLELHSPSIAAERLLEVINQLRPNDSGTFLDYRGKTVPW
jgi:NAD(P)-dependent dehydrogenase (short-subunit alcohol dehydrogenase family)